MTSRNALIWHRWSFYRTHFGNRKNRIFFLYTTCIIINAHPKTNLFRIDSWIHPNTLKKMVVVVKIVFSRNIFFLVIFFMLPGFASATRVHLCKCVSLLTVQFAEYFRQNVPKTVSKLMKSITLICTWIVNEKGCSCWGIWGCGLFPLKIRV